MTRPATVNIVRRGQRVNSKWVGRTRTRKIPKLNHHHTSTGSASGRQTGVLIFHLSIVITRPHCEADEETVLSECEGQGPWRGSEPAQIDLAQVALPAGENFGNEILLLV